MSFVSRKQQQSMGIVQGEPRCFVAPTPTQAAQPVQQQTALAVQPIKPAQLMDSHNALIGLYREQFKTAAKTGEIVTDNDQNVSYRLSTANELAERRKTARMYLLFLSGVNAMATTGVVSLAYLSHMTSSAAQSVAVWLVMFGMVQSWLTWRHLQREQTLSPEGLHLEQIYLDHDIHRMDAKTRRAAVDYMGQAELARVQLQQSQVDAQREANHRLTLETKACINEQMHRHCTPQSQLNRLNTYVPTQQPTQQPSQRAAWHAQNAPESRVEHGLIGYDLQDDSEALQPAFEQAEQPEAIVDPVRQRLLNFVSDLYLDYSTDSEGRKVYAKMHTDGRLKKGVIVPWAQRSDLTAAQRRQMEELLRQITPDLFLYDPERKQWQLNLANYRRVWQAVNAIDAALTSAAT